MVTVLGGSFDKLQAAFGNDGIVFRKDGKLARERWPGDPANMEVVVIFKKGRWAYVRAAKPNEAKRIHNIAPDDQPGLPSGDCDDDVEEKISNNL